MSTNVLTRRLVSLYLGLVLFGGSVALMLRSGLGLDPWDVLHQGLSEHTIRVARTAIEVPMLAVGWLLGGSLGVGTVLYALSIGPLAHFFIPRLAIANPGATADEPRRKVLTHA